MLVAVLMLMSVAAAAPALAVTKGAVTPRLVSRLSGLAIISIPGACK